LTASVPKREPYVIAHDPYGLYRHVTAALLAGLVTSPIWQARQLRLSEAHAREQARTMLLASLLGLRMNVLSLLLAEQARRSSAHLEKSFAELSDRCLGFCLPDGWAGILPRIRANDGQRLLGRCLAVEWSHRLVAQFDNDWFRNPQAILAIRDTLNRVLPIAPTSEQAESSTRELRAEFEAQL
jgi:Co/Zn/Cd efflux system component